MEQVKDCFSCDFCNAVITTGKGPEWIQCLNEESPFFDRHIRAWTTCEQWEKDGKP